MHQDDTKEFVGTLKWALVDPVGVFMNMSFVCKAMTFVALVCMVVGVVVGVLRRVNNGPRSGVLAALGVIGLVCGLLGGAYGGFTTYVAVQMMHVTRLVVYLPSLIQAGACLLSGGLAWMVAQVGNAGARRS